MLHFRILIKPSVLVLLHFYALKYENAYELLLIKSHIIIFHGITCVSNDIIDNVIKFAKFSVANSTEIG